MRRYRWFDESAQGCEMGLRPRLTFGGGPALGGGMPPSGVCGGIPLFPDVVGSVSSDLGTAGHSSHPCEGSCHTLGGVGCGMCADNSGILG